jgi:TetR/AcrR family transcriptional regulator, transcriptional repressor for nem operon
MGRPKTYDPGTALRGAVDLFWERGYHGSSIRDVVDAINVVPKSLYKEFGGKDALFERAIELYIEEQSERYRDALERPPLGLARLRAYYQGLAEIADARGCFLVNSLADVANIPPAGAAQVRRFFAWLETLYRRNVQAAVGAGELERRTDVEGLAAALLVFDQGLAVAVRSSSQRKQLVRAALALLGSLGRPSDRPPTARSRAASPV